MKTKKSDLLNMIQEQNDVIAKLIRQVNCHREDIIRLESVIAPAPQLIAIRTERDIAKELLEVDLSSELTGSDLCRVMLARGDNYIMCVVGTIKEVVIIDTVQDGCFYSKGVRYLNPKPINNQGEPLTQAEAGL